MANSSEFVDCDWMINSSELVDCDWMINSSELVDCDWMINSSEFVDCDRICDSQPDRQVNLRLSLEDRLDMNSNMFNCQLSVP